MEGVSAPIRCKDEDALFYERVSYLDVLNRGLKVIDKAAISLCMDNKLPIVVFNLTAARQHQARRHGGKDRHAGFVCFLITRAAQGEGFVDKKAEERMTRAVDHVRHELTSIRTGRASAALLDGIKVPYYGNPTPRTRWRRSRSRRPGSWWCSPTNARS